MRETVRAISLIATIGLAGCAGVPLSEVPVGIRQPPPVDLRLDQVLERPDAHIGRAVRWGGVIVGVAAAGDGAKVEVQERVLSADGAPDVDGPSGGRFLVLAAGTVDPDSYAVGLAITVAGTISGSAVAVSTERPGVLPVVKVDAYFVWGGAPDYADYPPDYRLDYRPYYYSPYYGYPYGYGYGYWPYYPYRFRRYYGPQFHFGFGYSN